MFVSLAASLLMAFTGVAPATIAPAEAEASGASSQARSDSLVRLRVDSRYLGNDIYNTTGSGQTRSKRIGRTGAGTFYIRVQNDGTATDTFKIKGRGGGPRFRVRYFVAGQNRTRAAVRGYLRFTNLPPGAARIVVVRVRTKRAVPKGARYTVGVTATSMSNGTVDLTKSRLYRPAYTANQQTVARQVNNSRAAYGLRSLRLNATLTNKAQQWANYLASIGYLRHSNLASGAPSNWRALAENVGYGSSLNTVHQAFLRSSGHRANIMGNYTHLGTGVAHKGGRVYVVHVFMRT